MALTPAGEHLLKHARNMYEQWQEVKEKALNSDTEISGIYRIGCHSSLFLQYGKIFTSVLMQENPKLNIHLFHTLSRRSVEQVISGRLDIALVTNPRPHPDLIIRELCVDTFTLWASQGSYNKNVFIHDPDLIQTQQIEKKLKTPFQQKITSNNLEVVANIVANGGGIGALPQQVALRPSYNLVPLKGGPLEKDVVAIIYRLENKKKRAIQEIADAIKRAYKVKKSPQSEDEKLLDLT